MRFLPWLLLIMAAVAMLLGSGSLGATQIGDRVFVWLLVAAGVAAVQLAGPAGRD